ncbi:PREDICTED: G-type lectin S-receptor-like serine/threonine-protein kinase SD3-1 [Prunus mume]|uniref:Receptor-like serine/threonine-protein kinase n=1 Tax=Prunus mume TaxID=102107 RepID=A0ABM1LW37_PRUMU|nr:PREDICTED: G-type lectin S-receptor-like serine/threonine-protein kinase SD3-1 [Prunus mume]XP_016651614.1 PREDICTED: G-type lectin S-receptor-like serine/threonine-protein kinase SD3-1 [Prunus mume]
MPEQDRLLLKLCFLLCIFAGFLLHSLGASEIPLDSKLSIVDKDMWVSPNGDFAFGFFNSPDEPNYSVGIRSNSKSIPLDKQIVVWIAGADLILGNNSYVQLTQDGELILFDSLKGVIWSSKTRQLSVVSAALNDNGNLVLLNKEKHIVWQSFDTPSDTLLPGQNFSMFQTLRAASKNSVSSYYTLFMNASGQLQLRWESHVIYWTSGSPSSSNLSAFLTSDGALQLRDQNLKPVWSLFGEDHNDSVSYRFLRLDVDGNLRLYSWVEPSKSWRSVWQAVENQCNVFATCGQHGICVFTESGSPDCECPFKHTNESISRCLIPNHPCDSGSDMLKYMHTFLYGMYPPTDDLVAKVSLQGCKSLCLNDPSCIAATFSNDGTARCLMKRTQYVTGYSDPSLSSVSFVKTCAYPLAVNPNHVTTSPSPLEQSHKFCFPCVIGVASGMFVVFVLVQLALGFWFFRRRNLDRKKAALAYTSPNSNGLIVLSFSEIEELTENFKHQIGPKMFKGVLPNKKPVAIKDLNITIEERKYRSAVSKIGSIHHKNLVKLQGYCCELDHRFLVYEYAKNGSVEKYLEDLKLCKKLTWGKRFDICLSVARAICYLHTSCREFMSHGNLKCENVVLEENLEAKVTEFGLGKVVSEASCSSAERDVEDFGKMVLVLVSGCRGVGDLCEWAYTEWMEGRPENVVDKRISGGFNLQELERSLRIAFWCLQIDERRRPSMREVVKVLEGTLSVDPPPPPFGCNGPPEEEEEP